ncbi:hypothetical protein, partial [Proteus mirabilis]|uniref:hypothetical protein n=1 Tax=Proteus mirabilis TaxID=584 RepID=UPI00391CB518
HEAGSSSRPFYQTVKGGVPAITAGGLHHEYYRQKPAYYEQNMTNFAIAHFAIAGAFSAKYTEVYFPELWA